MADNIAAPCPCPRIRHAENIRARRDLWTPRVETRPFPGPVILEGKYTTPFLRPLCRSDAQIHRGRGCKIISLAERNFGPASLTRPQFYTWWSHPDRAPRVFFTCALFPALVSNDIFLGAQDSAPKPSTGCRLLLPKGPGRIDYGSTIKPRNRQRPPFV